MRLQNNKKGHAVLPLLIPSIRIFLTVKKKKKKSSDEINYLVKSSQLNCRCAACWNSIAHQRRSRQHQQLTCVGGCYKSKKKSDSRERERDLFIILMLLLL
jgi:hypothetical protein